MNLEPGPAEIFWQAAPSLLRSEVCFQPTGSCVSQALGAAFPNSPSLQRAGLRSFEKHAFPLSKDTPIRSAALCGVQSFSDWRLPSCTHSLAWEAAHWVCGRTEDKSFPWRGWCRR